MLGSIIQPCSSEEVPFCADQDSVQAHEAHIRRLPALSPERSHIYVNKLKLFGLQVDTDITPTSGGEPLLELA